MKTINDQYVSLFRGNPDVYGSEQGGCVRSEPDWDGHLHGHNPIGIYPLVNRDGWHVRWGCVDLDRRNVDHPAGDYGSEVECDNAARNLVLALRTFGIHSWVEITRSHGRHVWVFAQGWVPATTMRGALMVACEIAGVPAREVNPKQTTLADGQVGNYVRLPYPGGEAATSRQVSTQYGQLIGFEDFVARAWHARTARTALDDAARLWSPPAQAVTIHSVETVDLDAALRGQIGPLARKILHEGPLPDRDRSNTLVRLAHLCREDGLTPEAALAVVTAADLSWGKFHRRADGERRLLQIVESTYAGWDV